MVQVFGGEIAFGVQILLSYLLGVIEGLER
jgi:hypothetical protein